jgi:hypothetical protein
MKSSESLDLFAPAFVKMQVDIVDAPRSKPRDVSRTLICRGYMRP